MCDRLPPPLQFSLVRSRIWMRAPVRQRRVPENRATVVVEPMEEQVAVIELGLKLSVELIKGDRCQP
jgi:hypothetical protein